MRFRKQAVSWKILAGLCLACLAAGAGSKAAQAGQWASGKTVILGPEQALTDDWYAAGERILLEGTVEQDAFLAGRWVEVRGRVLQDLAVIGQHVNVEGPVGGDLRALGENLSLESTVQESALLAARDLHIGPQTVVGAGLTAAARRLNFQGRVLGPCQLAGNEVTINGSIAGDVAVHADRLQLGPQADIQGSLTYYGTRPWARDPQAKVSGALQWQRTTRKKAESASSRLPWIPWAFFTGLILFRLTGFLLLLGVGCLLVWLFPPASRHYALVIAEHPWPSLGWGLLTLILIPVTAILLLLSLVGIPLALMLAVLAFLAAQIARLGVGYLVGVRVLRIHPENQRVLSFALGFTLFSVLTFIPILGRLLDILAVIVGLGAFWLLGRPVPRDALPAASAATGGGPTQPAAPAETQTGTPRKRKNTRRTGPAKTQRT